MALTTGYQPHNVRYLTKNVREIAVTSAKANV